MAKQKITIALVGDNLARAGTAHQLIEFAEAQGYPKKTTSSSTLNQNPSYVLQNFLFNDYSVDVVELTQFEKDRPKYDVAILPSITESNAFPKNEISSSSTHTHPPKNLPSDATAFSGSDALEDPYWCLAQKVGLKGDRLACLYLSESNITKSQTNPNDQTSKETIKDILVQLINTQKFLEGIKEKALEETKVEVGRNEDGTDSHKDLNVSKKPKPLPWHQKSRGLLVFSVILLMLSIGSFIGLVFTAFLLPTFLPFFLALLITLFILATFVAIKIAYDNRSSSEASSIPNLTKEKASENQINPPSSQVSHKLSTKNTAGEIDTLDKKSSPTSSEPENRKQKVSSYMRSNDPAFANQASKKIKTLLNTPEEVIVTFFINDDGQFFLDFSESKKYQGTGFETHMGKTLKTLFKEDFQDNRIPIEKVLNLNIAVDNPIILQKDNRSSETTPAASSKPSATNLPASLTQKEESEKQPSTTQQGKPITLKFNNTSIQILVPPLQKNTTPQEIFSKFSQPSQKTQLYWTDAKPSEDPMTIQIFKDLDTAIQNLKEASPLYVIEVSEDNPLQLIPIENDPIHFSLVSHDQKTHEPCSLFFRWLGTVNLTTEKESQFNCNWLSVHRYRDSTKLNSIQKLVAEASLKKKAIHFFEEKGENITSNPLLSGYFLQLFISYMPLIAARETNELNIFLADLSALSMNGLLAKYAKSNTMAAIVSAYYTVNPKMGAPSPWDYRAALRHLTQSYVDARQKNKKMVLNLGETTRQDLLFIRYFNDGNQEVIGETASSGQEGIDLKSGAYFYETRGVEPRRKQEDAIVFNRLSPAATAIYHQLSVNQKKDLMTRVCQTAEKKYGIPFPTEGSCGVFSFVAGKEIITSSLGDSVVFLVIRNSDKSIAKIQLLTDNHNVKYLSDEEVERIRKVQDDSYATTYPGSKYPYPYQRENRIHGLSISRAFGDAGLKPEVSSNSVIKETLANNYTIPEGGDAFLLLGCDGFYEGWDTLEKIDHTNYVEKFIARLTLIMNQELIKNASFYEMAFLLGQSAIVDFRSSDNVSLILKPIEEKPFLGNQTEQEVPLPVDFFGVLDGHGGNQVSLAIGKNIVSIVEEGLMHLSPQENLPATSAYPSPLSSTSSATTSSTASTAQMNNKEDTATSSSSNTRKNT